MSMTVVSFFIVVSVSFKSPRARVIEPARSWSSFFGIAPRQHAAGSADPLIAR